ncbi:MAG: 30S ribosomal protein S2 [Candidatus Omnitrophota bacterium]
MPAVTKELIQKLLEAGTHFGHQTRRWNPKMKPYIFGEKNKIHVIDLEKTAECLVKACDFLSKVASTGAPILFVGTKAQAEPIVEEQALRCGMFFVNHRWLGGMLTNYSTIRNSVKRYKSLLTMRQDGTFEALTKKEVAEFEKEIAKHEKNLIGVAEMNKLPGAMFVVDAKKEEIAILEANRLNIPVVAILDTNSDPDLVQYPIPGNDDAIRSVTLITSMVADAVLEGVQNIRKGAPEKIADKNDDASEDISSAGQSGSKV